VDEWLSGPGDLRVNAATRHAFVGGRAVELTRTPFDLLVALLRERGRVIPTADLIRAVWGFEPTDDIHFARTAIYRLRKQLRAAGAPHVIEAIRGVGFRIPGDVDLADDDPVVIGDIVATGSSTAMLVVTPDRRVKWANRAAVELTAYSVEELRALTSTAELTPPERRPITDGFWHAVTRGHHQRSHGVELLTKTGNRVTVNSSWKPLPGYEEAGFTILEIWPCGDVPGSDPRPPLDALID
jgi:PAS domain S-box-containing protein